MNGALGTGWGFLAQNRLQRIVELITRQQQIDRQFTFLRRTPVVPATSAELMGEFTGEVYAADVVMDDQEAVIHDFGAFNFQKMNIGNLKHGFYLGQAAIDELDSIRAQGGEQQAFIDGWITRRISHLLLGIRMRLEALIVSCYRDSTTYDRFGVKITGTWGTHADLKYSVPVAWNDYVNADPVKDLQRMAFEVAPDYQTVFTRATMGRKAFGHMLSCAKFYDKMAALITIGFNRNFALTAAQMPNAFSPQMMEAAQAVTGFQIELYDSQINVKNNDGSKTSSRILPHDEVILSDPRVDGNRNILDVGNAALTETIVAEILGSMGSPVIGGLPRRTAGPLVYATPTNLQHNPTGLSMWGAMRCWPRKWEKNATGLLDIGINPTTGA